MLGIIVQIAATVWIFTLLPGVPPLGAALLAFVGGWVIAFIFGAALGDV